MLEIWFSSSADLLPATAAQDGLKAVPAAAWEDMLDLVNCKVLSTVLSPQVDAYLLSESSMFVFPHKLILKTCGKTTLLSGLPRILEIAAIGAGFTHRVANDSLGTATAAIPYRVFYSRKNFIFPDRQRGPHRSWRDEVKSLDKLFQGGSAYMIGKMNGDHWYLYLTEPHTILTPPSTPERTVTPTKCLDLPTSKMSLAACKAEVEDGDETLEVLMTDLEPENAKQFYLDNASTVAEGQYYQKGREAEADVQEHMGSFTKAIRTNEPLKPIVEEDVDVFSNTSSDPADLMYSSTNDLSYPIDLTTEGHVLGTIVSESSGLANVYPVSKYPDARIDAYLFNPCGFSANGVIPAPAAPHDKDTTHYFTVHVTPEPEWSYASFETNVPSNQSGRETADLIDHVVSIFKPGRFSVTRFEGKAQYPDNNNNNNDDSNGRAVSTDGSEPEMTLTADKIKSLEKQVAKRGSRLDHIKGYRRVDRIVHDLEGYELVFKYYERFDWEGGGPRLGEAGVC